jgi:uncharacterized membrane protein
MEEERRVERGTEVERIVYFSDAVFAIAITLLVLEIQVPEGLSPTELTAALGEMWPKYLSYLISFTVIGGYWRAHHRIFHYVKAYDRRLISLNLLFLMCVAFLPFPVSLFGEYTGQRIAVEIYAGSVAATGLFLGGMWWYATRGRRLIDGDLDPRLIRHVMTERLSPPAIALIVVMITLFFGVAAAAYSLLPLLLIQFVVERNLPHLRARWRAKEESRRTNTEGVKKRSKEGHH